MSETPLPIPNTSARNINPMRILRTDTELSLMQAENVG